MALSFQSVIDFLFDSTPFMQHGLCLAWQPEVLTMHVASDVLIFLSYSTIPFAMIMFLNRRKDIEYKGLFILFAAFILACGATHAMAAVTIWHPVYGIQGVIKVITALVSVATAIVIWPIIPKALALPSPMQLRSANEELTNEINQRQSVESDLRQSRDELRISEERFRHFAEISADWFWEQNENFQFVYLSGTDQDLAGINANEDYGKTWRETNIRGVSETDMKKLEEVLSNHEPFEDFRFLRILEDGSIVHFSVKGRPVFDEAGKFKGYLGTGQDISSLIAAEKVISEERDRAQSANRAKSEFLANMSHEIRTPMAGVIGIADLVLETDLSPQQFEWIKSIRASGEKLLQILNEILDQSKLEAGKLDISPIDFNLSYLIDDTVGLFTPTIETKGLSLRVQVEEKLPTEIHGDSLRISQIISNLVSNAVKFTDTGSITVEANYMPKDGNSFFLRISVTDTGVGIDEKAKASLFSAFTQADSSISRKYGGTGLGLSISKQLVELMGGEMGLESSEGKGSTFWFSIPCEPAKGSVGTVEKRRSLDRWEASRPLKILIAEDTIVIQQLMRGIFEKLKHDITLVENGQLAFELYEKEDFDLILMDIRMPVMDGIEASRLIRNMLPEKSGIPIIALTADIAAGNIEEYMQAGINDVCVKPVDLPVLLKAINTQMGEEIHSSSARLVNVQNDQDETDTEENTPHFDNFSQVLERVSSMVDQQTNLSLQPTIAASALDGLDDDLVASLFAQFVDSAIEYCDKMTSLLVEMEENMDDPSLKTQIREMAHALKGQGETFGYKLITLIAAEAENICKQEEAFKPETINKARNHVEAIKFVIAKKISGHGGKAGQLLLTGLKENS